MAVTRQQKEASLAELREKFQKAHSVSFGQYAGLSVEAMSKVRRELRASNVEFKVAKRTLFKLAAREQGLELSDEMIEGTVGAAFSYDDAIAGPRILKKMSKTYDKLKLLGGIMEGKTVTVAEMKEIADLPSKEELMAKFVGLMRAPLQGFYGALTSPLASFARGLKEYSEKKAA